MKFLTALSIASSLLAGTAFSHERSQMTIVGAFHNPTEQTIVFSVHYLRPMNSKENIVTPDTGAYVLIHGKRFPIRSSDIMMCGSHAAGRNVIEEYTIHNYRVLGESKEIPSLRSLKSVTFGLDYTVNKQPIKLEREVLITVYEGKPNESNQDAQQTGTGQPASRPESKSEGSDKPQPEVEGRSR